jgi:hypothetical protein
MRLALLLAAFLSTAHAQEAMAPADRASIQRVITAQIDAFRHDDADAAFSYAAPQIQRQFGDAANFLQAVRTAYAPVYRPRSFTFGALAREGGLVMQKVEVIGPDGLPALALYDMEHETDGSWRISGCRLVKSELQEI